MMGSGMLKGLFLAMLFVASGYATCTGNGREFFRCVHNLNCNGYPNGHYPICGPECVDGYYVTCNFHVAHRRPCSEAWYTDSTGQTYKGRMVFDPDLMNCQRSVSSCPRDA